MKLNDTERLIIAQYIAEANLSYTNRISSPVTPKYSLYANYIKRGIDIVVSGILLLITLPINLLIGIATFFDVGRPLFFRQKRIGKDCEEFEIVKFRNMTNDVDSSGMLLLPEQRVTKWGKFVRKTSLDELLNLWSVFKGDMSLIGPRPLLPKYLPRYSERHKMRHAIRPGLECPRIAPTIDEACSRWEQQFENDVWYVENVSLAVDLKMVASLVKLVFDQKETKSRGEAQRGAFMGYDDNGQAMDSSDIPVELIQRMRREYGNNITPKSIKQKKRSGYVEK